MIEANKALLYDWYGKNEEIFKAINKYHSDAYDTVMILISQLADSHHAPYLLGIVGIFGLLSFISKKIRKHPAANQYLALWFTVFITLLASMGADKMVVGSVKDHFSYPRPYIALAGQDVHVLQYRGEKSLDDYKSFPSGHASMMTVVVLSLWPILTFWARRFGVLLIVMVCWSRMAMGMHFPADVIAGFAIAYILTVIIRALVFQFMEWVGILK